MLKCESMNYLDEFKKIVDNSYLSNLEGYRMNQLDNKDEDLYNETVRKFKSYSANEMRLLEDFLNSMTLISCFKAVLKMKVSNNVINDSKNSERKYVQARGAVPFEKGKRKWVGHYLGPINEVTDSDGKISSNKLAEGDAMVRRKVLARLREGYGV